MQDVAGKVAFVTGGASGIGLGIAQALLEAGAKVAIADIRADHLDEARHLLAAHAGRTRFIELDITNRAAFAAAADETEQALGVVQILCNNAGVGVLGLVERAGYSDWDWSGSVNLDGLYNGIHVFLPRMIALGQGGHIVNTASKAGLLPIRRCGFYTAQKAAVIALSEVMATELAEHQIGVSAFCPGPVQTNIRETGALRPAEFKDGSGYADIEAEIAKRPINPLEMTPREVGERVLNGIRANDLFIITHREFKEGVAKRFAAILASFPDEPINVERHKSLPPITCNPIYDEILAKKAP